MFAVTAAATYVRIDVVPVNPFCSISARSDIKKQMPFNAFL